MSIEELERAAAARTARRQTLATAMVTLFGDVAGALVVGSIEGWHLDNALRLMQAATAAAVLVYLGRRRDASLRASLICFLILAVPTLPLLVYWGLAAPESQVVEPLIAQKMVIMALALLTPESLALGIVLVGIVLAQSVLLTAMRVTGGQTGEPWVSLFYGVFALGLLLYRASERRLSRQLVRANAEAAALEGIAKSTLDVRDRLNTPLQSLDAGLELLRRRPGDERTLALIARLQAAVDRLKELSRRLAGG